ncbi:hypothetical protein JCGZ_18426 [Jatropha curcas]|uniref:Uncharacterized protein n=1 Tax=Jatropha curcas TaxID=180498 RepID=A0A067K0V3_JATCU|nr:hypothetical protein JCGZ_18426 [Jatropha curcas]
MEEKRSRVEEMKQLAPPPPSRCNRRKRRRSLEVDEQELSKKIAPIRVNGGSFREREDQKRDQQHKMTRSPPRSRQVVAESKEGGE